MKGRNSGVGKGGRSVGQRARNVNKSVPDGEVLAGSMAEVEGSCGKGEGEGDGDGEGKNAVDNVT